MTTIEIGNNAPAFSVHTQDDTALSLNELKGTNIVLYFYPKDDTPGCTTEAKDFTALSDAFGAANTRVIGISKDSVAKHCKFIDKHALNVTLLADESGEMCDAYGVWVEKSMYGKKYMGIERATYLIDSDGVVRDIWRKVKVKNHAQTVLDAAKNIG